MFVSVDGHVGPVVSEHLRPYCPKEHLDTFDAYDADLQQQLDIANKSGALTAAEYDSLCEEEAAEHAATIKALQDPRYQDAQARQSQHAGLWDPDVRRTDMDADGIAADIIFHGGLNGQPVPFSSTGIVAWSDPKWNAYEKIGVRIYNEWLSDYIATDPARHVGVAHVPISDPEAVVAEVEWAANHGLTSINLPAIRRDFPPYNDPVWEPLWAACEANDMVLNTHSGGGDHCPYGGIEGQSLFMFQAFWLARRSIWVFILGGVFERHPRRKLVFTEQNAGWVESTLEEMDSMYYGGLLSAPVRTLLPKPPSAYFLGDCWVGASFCQTQRRTLL